jgi:cytoskeletal protein RodZ
MGTTPKPQREKKKRSKVKSKQRKRPLVFPFYLVAGLAFLAIAAWIRVALGLLLMQRRTSNHDSSRSTEIIDNVDNGDVTTMAQQLRSMKRNESSTLSSSSTDDVLVLRVSVA